MNAPIIYQWNGEAMVPWERFAKLADKEFVVGQNYRLEENNPRSQATHNHFFASVAEAWKNLPEDIAERFATSDHLRKWALIKAGFRDERSIALASKAEAQRVAAFIKPCDDFAIVVVNLAVVSIYTAKSQSMRAMGSKDFQASKQAVLDVIANLVGVSSDNLQDNAGRAA